MTTEVRLCWLNPHYPIACCFPHLCTVAHHCHGKRINLTAKKSLQQKEKPHGKNKKNHFKISSMLRDIFYSFFFCREVILFAVSLFLFAVRFFFVFLFALWFLWLILLLWQSAGPPYLWNSVHKDSWFFSTCGHSWELEQTLLIWLAFIILAIEFVDWPVPKMLDIFVCQISANKAFKKQHSVTVVSQEQEDLISSPVSTRSARSAEHYDRNNVGRNESSSSENPLGN